MQKMIVSVSVN